MGIIVMLDGPDFDKMAAAVKKEMERLEKPLMVRVYEENITRKTMPATAAVRAATALGHHHVRWTWPKQVIVDATLISNGGVHIHNVQPAPGNARFYKDAIDLAALSQAARANLQIFLSRGIDPFSTGEWEDR